MNREDLKSIIRKTGGFSCDQDADKFLYKLNYLEKTNRYNGLINRIRPACDSGDFLGSVLEVNIAFQFESNNLPLEYSVKQNANHGSDIDFMLRVETEYMLYLEAKLLQQEAKIKQSVNNQIAITNSYSISLDADGINQSIYRIQNTIVDKVQKNNGDPKKFFSNDKNSINIVIIDVSESILGCVGIIDCLVAIYGSHFVQENFGNSYVSGSVIGLFQVNDNKIVNNFFEIIKKYEHVRSILHGVMFIFKSKNSGVLSYNLEHYMTWNSALSSDVCQLLSKEISKAIPIKSCL